jgi:hypothetical protein
MFCMWAKGIDELYFNLVLVIVWLDNNKVVQWLGRWGSEGLSMFMSEQGHKAPTKK